MQNSELYRRGMVVPLSQDALGAIRSSTVSEGTSVAVASLATESDFEWLWAKGFFAEINDRTGALLDDYEEDEIGVEHVVDVLRVATQFQSIRGLPPSVSTFLGNVADACRGAIDREMPVFFIL